MSVVVRDDTYHLTRGNTLADYSGQTTVEAQARRIGIPTTDGGNNDAVRNLALLLAYNMFLARWSCPYVSVVVIGKCMEGMSYPVVDQVRPTLR